MPHHDRQDYNPSYSKHHQLVLGVNELTTDGESLNKYEDNDDGQSEQE
jgi:hypothetical protein